MTSKIKNMLKVKWIKLKKLFTPQMSASWCDLLNEGVNKWTRKKHVFVTKTCFEGCLCVGNVSITHRGHLFYFRFMESYWLFTDFQVNLHISIWALSFWAPTRFPELIRPRYGPDGRYEFSSISNTHGVQLFLEIINT